MIPIQNCGTTHLVLLDTSVKSRDMSEGQCNVLTSSKSSCLTPTEVGSKYESRSAWNISNEPLLLHFAFKSLEETHLPTSWKWPKKVWEHCSHSQPHFVTGCLNGSLIHFAICHWLQFPSSSSISSIYIPRNLPNHRGMMAQKVVQTLHNFHFRILYLGLNLYKQRSAPRRIS